MRTNYFTIKSVLKALAGVASILCLTAAMGFGSTQVINLTAGPTTLSLPDGSTVPMWGYSCGAVDSSSTATCAKLNPNATGWSPVVITVPHGDQLQIILTNHLAVPTSLTIVGQLGGGLGVVGTGCTGGATCTQSPKHNALGLSWPIAGGTSSGDTTFSPPKQGPRVQSFATEVAPGATSGPLTWQTGTIALQDGTYLLETGTHPSIQAPMGLYGMVVVTDAPTPSTGTETATGTAYNGVSYNADVDLLFSEIDPVQNNEVQTAVGTSGFLATRVWTAACGAAHTCYPPAVNYVPLYYLINGVAFDKLNPSASVFPVFPADNLPTGTTSGKILVRMVNAGLRMHVPSIVGSQTTQTLNDPGTDTPADTVLDGFSLIAEDGNVLPGVPRVQNEVFMAAGKTYDVMVDESSSGKLSLPIYDRALSLSGDKTERDAGMIAYITANGGAPPPAPSLASAKANADTYQVVKCTISPCNTLVVSDPTKGVLGNDANVYNVQVSTPPTRGTLTLSADGTFTYTPNAGDTTAPNNPFTASDSFEYCGNGTTSGAACATVTLSAATVENASGITMSDITFNAPTSTYVNIAPPGPLAMDSDGDGYPLTLDVSTVTGSTCKSLYVQPDGGFIATSTGAGSCTFLYHAKNSQGTQSSGSATVTIKFPAGSGLTVNVVDGKDKTTKITDYRWIIEEDRTFYIDPTKTTNTPNGIAPVFGTNFHTSYMPVVAEGCTGPKSCESGQTVLGTSAACDEGDGICDTTRTQETAVDPKTVQLDPNKRYYISVLPGDAADPFNSAYGGAPDCTSTGIAAGDCGHGMGGAPIAAGQKDVTVLVERTPFQTAKLSVQVFEDDFPLNGEQDAGGGIDVLATNEPGLGGFNIELFDDAGGTGDATGQITYDMFNMPLSNSLSGQIDPATGLDACPISQQATNDPTQVGITGQVVTCPKYESDGKTLSPLAGQAVIANLYPGRYSVIATPGADRIARGDEWLQTNTLDGQKAHDSFLRIGEPAYFQEYGPAGYHVSIGFANPKTINDRLASVCDGSNQNVTGTNCTNIVTGKITDLHYSRTPDERVYSSGDYSAFAFTQCYVSVGDPDGEDFAFTKCSPDGTFTLTGLPNGTWRVTVFDQWNDLLVDGLSTPVGLSSPYVTGSKNTTTTNVGDIATNQWHADLYTSTFFDKNGDGVRQSDEPGLAFAATNIRFRDGSYSNFNNTDLNGFASFNEEFPLFNWYVVETDSTRFKNTGTHVVYDAGGPVDGTTCGSPYPSCGSSTIGDHLANTAEQVSVPPALRVPGAVYCDNADCTGFSIADGPGSSATSNLSTGRIDPPWVQSEGWQGFTGQSSFIEFGKKPYAPGENGGIHGRVVYASTRPFDDPQRLLQLSWEPLVPNVTMNLYQEGTAPDGSTSLKLVDTTQTSSWDDWAQGFRRDANGQIMTQASDVGKVAIPNMSCPGQSTSDLFYYSLYNQPMYLDAYNNGGTPQYNLAAHSQFKCYDAMHNWNQLQPAPYDGYYQFPSVTSRDPVTGKPTGTNCTICTADDAAATTDWNYGAPMLPAGKYVVEMIVPQGYELVKEEDKNILIGDNYIAPVTQEFAGLGNIFILPDQAEVGASYNGYNDQNPTQDLGENSFPTNEGDTGSVETFWRCVGQSRIVPDYISLFPQSQEVAPFAGATRNLCDRKEVTVGNESSSLATFYIFSSTHVAGHFTGIITDDFTSEFDPFSPVFGEKFSPPNMPISIKDFAGNEIARTYSDQWGAYDGITYSTWEVNPPNPTGYAPQMMVTCMNDKTKPDGTTDALFNPAYSQFCYETPFMPGQTQYMDTPVVPTSAFAGAGYNNPDCNYPDYTPAIASVIGSDSVAGPWVSGTGSSHTLTITALGNQTVSNYGYSGPSATAPPFNAKTVTRHYNFGTQCTSPTAGSADCNTLSSVTIGGVPATIDSWGPQTIEVEAPSGVPDCAIQQQTQYGAPAAPAQCGELVITAGNGKKSVDTVTVTIGGKTPTVLASGQTIQSAIDAAHPGDMIIVPPGTYKELLIMWKPVRLQGVGAASSIIDGNTHPAGKLDDWRRRVDCLFGLALNGQPSSTSNPFDPSGSFTCGGWTDFSGGPNYPSMVVDRIPLEGILGWDTTVNGNLAEMLQEPSLMGAYEGAAITVLSKGVNIPANSTDVFGSGAEAAFPDGTTLLTATDCTTGDNKTNLYPSNFQCNPSSIDGLGITDSSQGGGGIYVHGWAHNLQIANNRVFNNAGTLSGGITIGQGEFPGAYLSPDTTHSPTSCGLTGDYPITQNSQLPYCFNLNVNVHNNMITNNSSTGDELFSATPAGAGGVSICTGADYYKFNYNWVCGNLSTGDGGGVGQLGFAYYGDIEHNTFLFNQSQNPTIPTNGGGLIIMGAPPDGFVNGVECGSVTDQDCKPGLGDGAGPGLVVNANLFMGNSAESGSGGALRFQAVNGTEVARFPNPSTCSDQANCKWYMANVTNNIIADNVAGWDGAGVSLEDSLVVNFVNNTVVSNDTTASAGPLFSTLGAPLASSQSPPGSTYTSTSSLPQPAGLVSLPSSPQLTASLTTGAITCPAGHYNPGNSATSGDCVKASYPLIANDLFWENRSFYIGVGALDATYQQNVVALYDAFSNTLAPSQPVTEATAKNGNGVIITGGTGACIEFKPSATTNYWDIGVRGDTGPGNHNSGIILAPTYSFITDPGDYPRLNNSGDDPTVLSQYCNGSRIPPEFGGSGYQVPPGIADATMPNPTFSLKASATVDEGNNWVNMSWGPLSLTNPATGATLGNYALAAGSHAIDYIPNSNGNSAPYFALAPSYDFFGNPRKVSNNPVDAGAVEFQGSVPVQPPSQGPTLKSINPTKANAGQTVTVTLTGTYLTGTTAVNAVIVSGGSNSNGITVSNVSVGSDTKVTANFGIKKSASGTTWSVTVTTPSGTSNNVLFTVN